MPSREARTAPPRARGGLSRREFVKGAGALAAGATLLALGSRLALNGPPAEIAGEALLRSTFAGRLGATFTALPEAGGSVALRLVEIGDLPGAAGTDEQREHSFSLLFLGAAEQPLTQGIYQFQQRGIGTFAVFIVPKVPAAAGRHYEAIFNRLPG